MKLAVDRDACVESGIQGRGEIGNDLVGSTHPSYNSSIPQREYDPERARQLLQEAGQQDLRVELVTTQFAGGMAECAQVLKESASAAGITIDVRTIPGQDLFNPEAGYLSYGFGATSWTGPSFQETE
jgi:peptide/nickel transport system substrate-binding protein